MKRFIGLGVLVAAIVSGCESAESARVEDVRGKLVGTWLTEAESGPQKLRRVLALAGDGKFTDHIVIATAGQREERVEFSGEWSYDGANLKRRFLRENGRQYSGSKIRFATFPLVSASSSEFVVDDNIQGAKVAFRRVPDGTAP